MTAISKGILLFLCLLPALLAGSFSPCDVNQDGVIDIKDNDLNWKAGARDPPCGPSGVWRGQPALACKSGLNRAGQKELLTEGQGMAISRTLRNSKLGKCEIGSHHALSAVSCRL